MSGCGRRLLTFPLPHGLTASRPLTLFLEPFHQLDPERWKEIEVKGQTQYSIQELNGSRRLQGHSQNGASILMSPFRFNPETYEWLSWSWRVDKFVEGEDLATKEGSDASARVYVYFDTPGLPWQKRSIDYVWSAKLPEGTMLNSAFSKHAKIVVVDSGTEHAGSWRTVVRNIERDYQRCFGRVDPPDVVAVGLMVDTDNTRSEAMAYFDDVMISRDRPPQRTP